MFLERPDVTRMKSYLNAVAVSGKENKEICFNEIERSELIIFPIYWIGIAF